MSELVKAGVYLGFGVVLGILSYDHARDKAEREREKRRAENDKRN